MNETKSMHTGFTYNVSRDVFGLSPTSSIVRNDFEDIFHTGTWKLWGEGVVCVQNLSEVSAMNRL